MTTRKLIINADDYNLTPGVSLGIVEAFKNGVVKSTTVMINMNCLDKNLKMLKDNPNLAVGLHVNFTCGKPVSKPSSIYSLVDENGNFWRKPGISLPKAEFSHIRTEAIAQLKLAREYGINLTHIDTHHYYHNDPETCELLAGIAKDEKLAMRSSTDRTRTIIKGGGLKTTDFFTDKFYGDEAVNQNILEEIFSALPEGTSELCCHPGYVDEKLLNISSYSYNREKELMVLTSPETKDLLKKYKIDLINFERLN